MPWAESYLQKLEQHLGTTFPTMQACYERSEAKVAELSELVGGALPSQSSFVAFGSLARKEYTEGSDLDWCLLIDGRADAGHRDAELNLKKILAESGQFGDPNPAGAFGALVFGHELIHCIGGSHDTNANLTRRLLLLVESVETAPNTTLSPRRTLVRGILQRYFAEEAYFPGKGRYFPRFFLNDVVRYWRTIAVDYAAKLDERGASGWALRNAKLRFSRKLLYVAGLLLSYEATLFPESDLAPRSAEGQLAFFDESKPQFATTEHCYHAAQLTPLELLARACIKLDLPKEHVASLFHNYDAFLGILVDSVKREELKRLTFADSSSSMLFFEVRDLGHRFQTSLNHVFLTPGTALGDLTLKYGVF